MKVGTERRGDLVRKETPDTAAIDAPHHFTEQIALRNAVITGLAARLPPRRLGGEQRGKPGLIVEILAPQWLIPGWQASGMGKQMTHQHLALAALHELRPVARDRRIDIHQATARQHQQCEATHGLGGGEDVDEGVALPRRAALHILKATPQVDHQFVVHDHRHRCTDIAMRGEVARESLFDGRKARGAGAAHIDRRGCSGLLRLKDASLPQGGRRR